LFIKAVEDSCDNIKEISNNENDIELKADIMITNAHWQVKEVISCC